jgi:hypothetical protein
MVKKWRKRMPDGVRDHPVDLGGLPQFLDPVQMAQVPRAHLPGRGPFREHGCGVGEGAAEHRGKHACGKPQLAHGQHHQPMLGQRLGGRQHAHVVGRLARRRHHLVGVGLHLHDPVHDGVHGRRGLVVVVGNDHMRAPAKLVQPVGSHLRGFDFEIHGQRPVGDRAVQHGKLFFHAAVESSVVLVPPAGGQNDGVGKLV